VKTSPFLFFRKRKGMEDQSKAPLVSGEERRGKKLLSMTVSFWEKKEGSLLLTPPYEIGKE